MDHVRAELGLSERRVCRVLGQHRSSQRKVPQQPDDKAVLTADIIAVLSDLFILRGVPGYVRSDNGREFVAQAVREWIAVVGPKTAYIEPGSPWESGYCEAPSRSFEMTAERRDLFHAERGSDRDRKLEAPRQYGAPARILGLPATRTKGRGLGFQAGAQANPE